MSAHLAADLAVTLENDRPGALPRFNHAYQFQASNRVSNRTAAYLQHLGQLAFGRQLVTRF